MPLLFSRSTPPQGGGPGLSYPHIQPSPPPLGMKLPKGRKGSLHFSRLQHQPYPSRDGTEKSTLLACHQQIQAESMLWDEL